MLFLPKGDYRVDDQWRVVGLQGTDSNTVVVDKVFIPAHRVFWLERAERTGQAPGQTLNPSPLYRLPFVPTPGLALTPAAVGSARAAIAHFQQWIEERVPVFKVGGASQREMSGPQTALAEAVTTMDAVEGMMLHCADEIMSWPDRGRRPTEQESARYYAWRSYMVRQSARVVDRLFELSGGHAIYLQHPLQIDLARRACRQPTSITKRIHQ